MRALPEPTADTPTIAGLLRALDKLDPEQAPMWGKMSAPQMVWHCRRFVELYRGELKVAAPIRWIARAVGPVFLKKVLVKSPMETPRNLGTIPAIRSDAAPDPQFAAEVEQLRAGLQSMEEREGIQPHSLYGTMRAQDAEALVRHHTAHHFHQFDLL